MSLISTLQNIRSPFLDIVAGIFSLAGNEIVFLCVLGVIFWCLNKRVSYRIALSYILAGPVFFIVRGAAHVPRPWSRNPYLAPAAFAVKGTTGYSMPSAHTLYASVLGARFVTNSRMILAKILAVLAVLLTGFSRIYLGLNTWLDVLIAMIIAAAGVFAADYILDNLSLDSSRNHIYAFALAVPTALMLVISMILYIYGTVDLENLAAAVNSSGISLGLIAAWFLDSTFTDFTEKCDFAWQQVLKAIIGIVIILVIRGAVSVLLQILAPRFLFANFFCNLVAVLIAFGLYPLLIKKYFSASYR